MTLFPRLKATLTAMFAPAEDPRQEPAAAYQRQLELVGRVLAALAEIAVSKKQLEGRTEAIRRTCTLLRRTVSRRWYSPHRKTTHPR